MSLSPRRLLRPWLKKSSTSIKDPLWDEETVSTVDYSGQRSKQSHGMITVRAQRKESQLGEQQEEIVSLGSIITASSKDSSREQAEAVLDQRLETSSKQVDLRQSLVSQQPLAQESESQKSLDDKSPSPFVHEIQYTYKLDNRPIEDRNIEELFNVPPPDGNNLRTVQELLEGSDSLPPWLRNMLLEASVKVRQEPCAPHEAKLSKDTGADSPFLPLIRCESADSGISAGISETGDEATTVMSSYSDLSEMMDNSTNPCSWFKIY
jgi:hypothetical protein